MPATAEAIIDVRLVSKDALAVAMQFRGITVRELAERSKVNRSTIGHLRSGKRTSCTPVVAARLAKALDTPTELIFKRKLLRAACDTL